MTITFTFWLWVLAKSISVERFVIFSCGFSLIFSDFCRHRPIDLLMLGRPRTQTYSFSSHLKWPVNIQHTLHISKLVKQQQQSGVVTRSGVTRLTREQTLAANKTPNHLLGYVGVGMWERHRRCNVNHLGVLDSVCLQLRLVLTLTSSCFESCATWMLTAGSSGRKTIF